jgi:para-aminobenzoate synthetase/4-amino-4-deoxychorismate lyase
MTVDIEPRTFELLETMKWTPAGGFSLLDRHLNRLARSAEFFGYACDTIGIRRALDSTVTGSALPLRIRLLVARDGTARIESTALEPAVGPARVALSLSPIDPGDVFLYHKTTNRTMYERAKRPEFDDVILWNADGQVTESTIGNVVAEIGGRKLTPPVSCGLLAGTFRQQLLDDGVIEEGLILIGQLATASCVWLINSVREWWPAVLDPGDHAYKAAAIASTPTTTSTPTPQTTNRSQR